MVKAVIFDKDGVIIHSAPIHFKSWRLILKEFGIDLKKHNYLHSMMGRSAKENIVNILGDKIKEKNIGAILKKKDYFFKKFFNLAPKVIPGVIPFLRKLKYHHIPVALASSSRLNMVDFILDSLKIRNYFDAVVVAEDVTRAKPDPELFVTAAKKLNTPPSECVVFEDSYSGIEAAKKAGMKVILVATSHKKHRNVDMAIKDFTKITVNDIKNI